MRKQLPAAEIHACSFCNPDCIVSNMRIGGKPPQTWCASFSSGGVLYNRSAPASYIYGVCEGLVKQVVYLADGSARIVRIFRRGDLMGLEGLVDDTYHSTTIALSDVCTYVISTAQIMHWDKLDPFFHRLLLNQWLRNQDCADAIIVRLGTGKAESRMARLIVDWLAREIRGSECLCRSPSREDMAALLGLTAETSSRVIADFKRRGLVGHESARHFPCDFEQMKNLAGM